MYTQERFELNRLVKKSITPTDIKQRNKQLEKIQQNKRSNWVKEYHMFVFRDKVADLYEQMIDQISNTYEYGSGTPQELMNKILELVDEYIYHHDDLNKILQKEIRNHLIRVNGRGETIASALIRTMNIEVLDKLIVKSRNKNTNKSCLSAPNSRGKTFMHYVLQTKNESFIRHMLFTYAEELGAYKYNQPHGQTKNPISAEYRKEHPYPEWKRKYTTRRIPPVVFKRKYTRATYVGKFMQPKRKNFVSMNLLNTALLYFTDKSLIYALQALRICDIGSLVKEPCISTGNYPLHIVMYSYVRSNQKKMLQSQLLHLVDYFVSLGADLTKRNGYGFTPAAFLVYIYDLFSCFVDYKAVVTMLRKIQKLAPRCIFNDLIPTGTGMKSLFWIILVKWPYYSNLQRWMIEQGAVLNEIQMTEFINCNKVQCKERKLWLMHSMRKCPKASTKDAEILRNALIKSTKEYKRGQEKYLQEKNGNRVIHYNKTR
jgi:hypothetical protein